jgi:hypothetical protein
MTADLHPFAVALENANPEAGKSGFIYVLKLVPRLYDDMKWTKEDNAALDRHFSRLQEAQNPVSWFWLASRKSRGIRHSAL